MMWFFKKKQIIDLNLYAQALQALGNVTDLLVKEVTKLKLEVEELKKFKEENSRD